MTWTLGIDPGQAGAAVALAPDGFAEVLWSWRTGDKGILVRIAQVTEEGIVSRVERVRSPPALGVMLVSGLRCVAGSDRPRIVCEHVHVGKNASTGIEQALWVGRVVGPLELAFDQRAQFLRPTEWRRKLGVNQRLRGRELKEDSARRAAATIDGLAALVSALGRKSALAHDYEAGGVAWAGSMT